MANLEGNVLRHLATEIPILSQLLPPGKRPLLLDVLCGITYEGGILMLLDGAYNR